MSVLAIDLHKVTETAKCFRLECDSEWWNRSRQMLREPGARMSRGFVVELEAHRIGARILLRGSIDGAVELACGSCLDPYVYDFHEPLELLLEPAPPGTRLPESGLELDPEDAQLGRYAGEELDLEPAVHEILALGWPMHPRCKEECEGLCPSCGCNRNRESCSCGDAGRNRPFARLDELIGSQRRDEE